MTCILISPLLSMEILIFAWGGRGKEDSHSLTQHANLPRLDEEDIPCFQPGTFPGTVNVPFLSHTFLSYTFFLRRLYKNNIDAG